jgi:tetratricopeptide (TPR) repeat protein
MKLSDDEDQGFQMDCQQVENKNVIERYLADRLSEQEMEAFEQHYLECARCFDELQLRHATAIELARRPIPLTPARKSWVFSWQWSLAFAAVVLAVLASVLYMRSGQQARSRATQIAAVQPPDASLLEQLAVVDEIPPYLPGVIRGGETNPALINFQEGMRLYSAQKYAEAVAPLTEASHLDPQHVPTAFYLGISHLVAGSVDSAIEQLSKAARQPEYSEEAHWFLAKAHLKKRDVGSARGELNAVVSLHGAYSSLAQDLLRQIQKF